MDYDILRETLRVTLDEIAFRVDDDGKNVSIINKAQEDLKAYLEDNTSISDDEKAKQFASFLTNTITGVTVQAISVAGQAPLQSAQIDTMVAESAQKIISMQNEDKARLNDSAVNVAKAKAEIETLVPAQVAKINAEIASMNKDLEIKTKEIELKTKEIELMAEEIPLKQAQLSLEEGRLALMEADLPLKQAQLAIEESRLTIMEADLPLKEAQVEVELKKVDLMDKDILLKEKNIELEDKRVNLMEVQTEQEGVKIGLMQAQTEIEYAKLGLNAEQIRLTGMEVEYKKAQMLAIEKAGQLNKDIEEAKNQTQIEIAEIYAYGKV